MSGRSTFAEHLGSLYHCSLTLLREGHKNRHASANTIGETLIWAFMTTYSHHERESIVHRLPHWPRREGECRRRGMGKRKDLVHLHTAETTYFQPFGHVASVEQEYLCRSTYTEHLSHGAWLWWAPSFCKKLGDSPVHSMPQFPHLLNGTKTWKYLVYTSHWNYLERASKKTKSWRI